MLKHHRSVRYKTLKIKHESRLAHSTYSKPDGRLTWNSILSEEMCAIFSRGAIRLFRYFRPYSSSFKRFEQNNMFDHTAANRQLGLLSANAGIRKFRGVICYRSLGNSRGSVKAPCTCLCVCVCVSPRASAQWQFNPLLFQVCHN